MIITAKEYDVFTCAKERDGCVSLDKKDFDALEKFITEKSDQMLEIMGISVKKGVGRVITAKKYVGVIALSTGNTIEILPKIYSENVPDKVRASRKLLSDMISTLHEPDFKQIQTANIAAEKTSVLDIFIRKYINDVFSLVKTGLISGYETVCENLNFFKGKIKFNEQVKYNYAHKERSYAEFDLFTQNRPENRIIKSTLRLLYRVATHHKSKSDLRTLLELFSEIELSKNYEADFAKISIGRNNKKYETILLWSRVFLSGKSFSTFAGSQISLALLFPMDKLFESYVAALVKKIIDKTNYKVYIQDKRYALFDEPKKPKRFGLKPDIVIEDIPDKETFVMDTKWKVLSPQKRNYDIDEADMYQMFAYSKRYSASSVTLIYPLTKDKFAVPEFHTKDGVNVKVRFIDLFDAKNSIQKLLPLSEPVAV